MERPAEPSESGGKENVTAREQQQQQQQTQGQQQHQHQPSGTLKGEEIHKKKVYFEIDDRNTVQDVLEVSNFKIEGKHSKFLTFHSFCIVADQVLKLKEDCKRVKRGQNGNPAS